MFAKFRELRSAKAVMRYLRGSNLLLPVRPLLGPTPHEVVWRVAHSARVVQILKSRAMLGASMADGARTRCADSLAVGGSGSWPSRPRIGRSVSRTPTRLISPLTKSMDAPSAQQGNSPGPKFRLNRPRGIPGPIKLHLRPITTHFVNLLC